jgi:putative nucleotidyltransferase with HDIG domain/PAS domain S-box-containing protein
MESATAAGLIEHLPIGVLILAPDTRVMFANPAAARLLSLSQEQMLGKCAGDPIWRFIRDDGTRLPLAEFPVNQVLATVQLLKDFVLGVERGDGGYTWLLVNAFPDFDDEKKLQQVVITFADITDRKAGEERIQRQLEYLTALSDIDRAISSGFDLRLNLITIITQVIAQLKVAAADVMIFNPVSQILEYSEGRGFRNKAVVRKNLRLGECYAGRAALERRTVHIASLAEDYDSFLSGPSLAGEAFVSYYGVPLIAKGQIHGVMEVFLRTHLVQDKEWHDFFKTLADQAAIAIENATLFENLQRSNAELALAYDSTIEGWSRALDLRDRETEGHTQRVTDITVKLAESFGLSGTELVHIRWGALLHDIGKMGIPDEILRKPNSLTENEWLAMKKHPVFAYEMLSPIRYLRSALDIPYSHHERWDGTGYPLGLKGEQIPLAARIFALVDTWDALRSDRPYQSGLSAERSREAILALAGTHLDPYVVKVSLELDLFSS